ncbi:hypothetical protein SUGI_0352440 [Cryptomeria japonica]|nr:hypothetical protein SUGI_0352440 [Cryptomeria japonica]
MDDIVFGQWPDGVVPSIDIGDSHKLFQISHEAPASETTKWSRSHPDVSQRGRDIRDRGHPSAGSTR